ncbi:GNAT family N-acetyltransferase [Candidatus Bathyarchaeota archaeon A05DMB-2]|jgi:ABC-type lipoprotein export system ATPase subunit/GNAT superfamily N-acetyltransferase|nr:GNAT family N-acetyltransferase [Candidatus Bathyarchaeota archaeon A05DMB-2]
MRKQELFRIHQCARRYDRETGKFIITISYETAAPEPTERVVGVAEGFGLGLDQWQKFVIYDNVELKIGPQDIVYITGDSGSGKSVLLKALEKDIRQDMGLTCINIAEIKPEPNKPLIETVGKSLEEALELLSRVGLNDAFLFLRTYEQLSDGQKYRYKIAKMIESGAQFWIMDEFAATLDRDTAKIVAYNLQKLARQQNKAVLAATTHTDLLEDLNPSVHIHKRFGKEITVNYYPNQPAKECSLIKEMRIEEGTTEDWRRLAGFHYRSHKIAAPRKIFCIKRGEELCGVIVYNYPPPTCFGRRLVLPKMTMRELNEKLSIITRVVVHPKYRTIGLGAKLVKETLPLAGTPYVEMPAVMAKYNPFAEKAGMQKIAEQPPPKEAVKIAEILQGLGFNIQLLGSEKYVLNRLQTLSHEDMAKIKEAFIKYCHARYMKYFFCHMPFGKKQTYAEEIHRASLERLARLIKVCGFLLQTKVYLFWKNSSSIQFSNKI